eukprot:scaffold8306_cov171-Amphora_coffeaeformis.AAC.16
MTFRAINPHRTFIQIHNHTMATHPKLNPIRTTMKPKNPIKESRILQQLLRELDSITSRRQFRRWRKSFLAEFEIFLFESGNVKVRIAYRNLCTILSRHVELVKKMHVHIQQGDLSPDGSTVRARQTLGNFFDQMIRVKQILIDLLPTTAQMEKEIGYTKFHLAAVLIDNGFLAYDRLMLCDEIHFHFKHWCLQDVANKLFNLEMDHYRNQLDIFCDIMADLGINKIMQKALQLLHKDDDEETLFWEHGESLGSMDVDMSSESSEDGLDIDLDPMPDLSDITFEEEDEYSLPLWKVNNFYKDNAEMAESFRRDMKRKSFEMFNVDSSHSKTTKPPGMPRRSVDSDIELPKKPERTLDQDMGTSVASLPVKPPQRRISNGGADLKEDNPKSTEPCTESQQLQSNDSTKMSPPSKSSSSHTRKTIDCELSDSDETKNSCEREENSESSGGSQKKEESKDSSVTEVSSRLERFGVYQRQDTSRFILPATNFLATPSRMSKISAPAVNEAGSNDDSDNESEVSFSRASNDDSDDDDNAKAVSEKKQRRQKSEPKKKSFYSFNNYYHGNPSDWRVSKSDH